VTGVVTLGSTTTSALTTAAGASITTGTANDIVSVNSSTLGAVTLGSVTNSDGVLTDNDTLYLIGAQGSGTGVIDLSQSGDQILTINGQSNTTVQTGIDSVNVASMTSTNSYGWTLTARSAGSTITGSGYNDVINGGAGADTLVGGEGADTITTNGGGDTITGGAGADTITLGSGADTVIFTDKTFAADSISGFSISGGDILKFIDATALSLLGSASLVYAEGTQADGTADLDDVIAGGGTPLTSVNVIVITDAVSTFTAGGIDTAVDTAIGLTSAGNGGVIVIAAAATGDAKIWFDADGDTENGTPGAATYELATLVGVAVADLIGFASTNFLIG
jgi:hypothetical protein